MASVLMIVKNRFIYLGVPLWVGLSATSPRPFVPRGCGLFAPIPHAGGSMLKKALKVIRCVARKLLEIPDKMRLIEKSIFVTEFCEWFGLTQGFQHSVKPHDSCKFFRGSPDKFSKALFKRTLTDIKLLVEFLYPNCSPALFNQLNGFNNQLVSMCVF